MNLGVTMVFAIVAVILALSLKSKNPEYSTFISVAVCLVLLFICVSRMRVMLSGIEVLTDKIRMDSTYLVILVKLIGMVQAGRINRNTASKVFRGIFAEDLDPEEWVTVHGLEQIRDERVIAGAVARVLEEHPQSAADYRAGKEKALGFLMGRVMKELKGKADPGAVNALLKSRLETGGSEGG